MVAETTTKRAGAAKRKEESESLSGACQHSVQAAMEEYPITTTVGVFACGLTVGVLAGAALARPWHLHDRRSAETLGRKILDAVREYVPQSVNQYLPS